jgi:hypothetical protein
VKVETKERGPLAATEVEALQAARTVADDLGVASIRTCVAQIFINGVSRGEERQTCIHILALEMHSLGLPVERISEKLLAWNYSAVEPPLPESEIRKVIRRLERPGVWPYGCNNPRLQIYCIGKACPYSSNRARWEGSEVTPNGLTASGWLPELSAAEVKCFLGLYRLARLKGRGPAGKVPFCFRELERVSGINRRYHRDILTRLQSKKLLEAVHISDTRGEPSSFSFPLQLPPLPLLNNRG